MVINLENFKQCSYEEWIELEIDKSMSIEHNGETLYYKIQKSKMED